MHSPSFLDHVTEAASEEVAHVGAVCAGGPVSLVGQDRHAANNLSPFLWGSAGGMNEAAVST